MMERVVKDYESYEQYQKHLGKKKTLIKIVGPIFTILGFGKLM